jgi:hypothetical protein
MELHLIKPSRYYNVLLTVLRYIYVEYYYRLESKN